MHIKTKACGLIAFLQNQIGIASSTRDASPHDEDVASKTINNKEMADRSGSK
jgi:hypothetical protein